MASQQRYSSCTHSHFHPLARSSLDCNSSIASTALELPIDYFLPTGYSMHWKLTHWLFHIGLIVLEPSSLDQQLYYIINRFVLDSIFIGLPELLSKFRDIGYIWRNINTHFWSHEFKFANSINQQIEVSTNSWILIRSQFNMYQLQSKHCKWFLSS